jgi:hypothetical protein
MKQAVCCGEWVCNEADSCKAEAIAEHASQKLPCGHQGCSNIDGCRTCKRQQTAKVEDDAIAKDKVTVGEMLKAPKGVHSEALISTLKTWLKDPKGQCLKRERQGHAEEIKRIKSEAAYPGY